MVHVARSIVTLVPYSSSMTIKFNHLELNFDSNDWNKGQGAVVLIQSHQGG